MIASVVLISRRHIIDQTFDYKIPYDLEKTALPGMRAVVPFGIYNNPVEALIVGVSDSSERMDLKRIKSIVGEKPICTDELLELCHWMQRKYICPFYSAFKLIVPPGMKLIIKEWISLAEPGTDAGRLKLSEFQQKTLDAIRSNGDIIEFEHLEEVIASNALRRTLNALLEKGLIRISENVDDSVKELTVRCAKLSVPIDEAYMAADFLRNSRAKTQANMLLTLADSGKLTTSELISLSGGNYSALAALRDKGYIELYSEKKIREVYDPDKYDIKREYEPTEEQKPIIEYVDGLLDRGEHEKILIRGVTGSGKTEVFLQTIRRCLELGKRAIMLVPEISLTPQMVERFVSRFGSRVAVIHSGLSYGERYDQWNKISNSEVDVVVGARSAIFAPLKDIGLIILDEEHENSYKSEISPRYHAREIAAFRAEKNCAPLILASATPSVDSFYRASDEGGNEYRLFEMNHRYNNNSLPNVRVVDMRSEIFDYHNMSPISGRLEYELRENLNRGEKSILFLNRRGYNTFVSCRKCGYVMECKNCSIPLTYHKYSDTLVCHYCGYTVKNVTSCPECGSKHVKFFGTGTQKIEDELKRLFPEARILRMDRDTTMTKGSHEHILSSFKNRQADILLGTQMVTKGLDFADVTLVGVLAADSSLGVDDFRANERTFSLLTQVCGRAGRGDVPGRAVIQTYQPKNSTIKYARNHDYVNFYKNEIKFRKRLIYPPFCDIINILVSGEDIDRVTAALELIHSFIRTNADRDNIIMLSEPMPAPISRIKGSYRRRVFMKVRETDKALDTLHEINKIYGHDSHTTLVIDINPINMN